LAALHFVAHGLGIELPKPIALGNVFNFDDGLALLELAQNAHLSFKEADPEDRRELLRHLGSNFQILDGKVLLELRPSFKSMLAANVAAHEMAPDAMQNGIWWAVVHEIRTELTA